LFCLVGVLVLGKLLVRRKISRAEQEYPKSKNTPPSA
jgi:hypothetical protein